MNWRVIGQWQVVNSSKTIDACREVIQVTLFIKCAIVSGLSLNTDTMSSGLMPSG